MAMVKRLIVMQCGERSLGHLSLVFGLLAVGTLSLSVATDFWLFTTEALDSSRLMDVPSTTPSPDMLEPPPTADIAADQPSDAIHDYSELNVTDDAMEDAGYGMNVDLVGAFPIVEAKLHSGLWRSCIYFDDQGQFDTTSMLHSIHKLWSCNCGWS